MHVAYYLSHPLRPPQWRYQYVLRLHSLNLPLSRYKSAGDPYIWPYYYWIKYLTAAGDNQDERQRVINRRPYLAAAHFMYFSDDIFTRQVLQARILARQTDDEIAGAMGIEPAVVEQFEKVFFNVRDRLEASGYILKAAIRPHDRAPRNRTESAVQLRGNSLRHFGYFGGPLVVDFLVGHFRSAGNPSDFRNPHDWLAATFKDTIAVATAIAALDYQVDGLRLMKLAIRQAKRRNRRK